MRFRSVAVLLGVSALFALMPGPASSSTPASYDEAQAMSRLLPEHVDCYAIRVSSVDPTWAAAKPYRGAPGCSRGSRPIVVLLADESGWHVDPASRRLPPDPKSSCQYFNGHGGTIPAEPALDLGLCTPAVDPKTVTVECRNVNRSLSAPPRRGKLQSLRRPKRCNTMTSTQSNAEAVDLLKLRWSSWGGDRASGSGLGRAWHASKNKQGRYYFPTVKVKVIAHDPFEYAGKRWYTRLTIKNGGRSSTIDLDSPPGTD